MSRTRTSGRDGCRNSWERSRRGKFLKFPSVGRWFGWWRVGFGCLSLLLRYFFILYRVRRVGFTELRPLRTLLTLRLVIGALAFRGRWRHESRQSQGCGSTENGKEDSNFSPPIFSSLHRHLQAQPRVVRDLYATAADSTLSYRRHESAARCRRTKHSDVEGQETNQKPRCCQRVPSIVTAISLSMTL